jgi:hypothetical protein
MLFTYIMSGWEGSASDSHIIHNARQKHLQLPHGKYLLADAGFCHAVDDGSKRELTPSGWG